MPDFTSADWKSRVLRHVAKLDGGDAYKTVGKSPIWSGPAMAIFRGLIDDRLLSLDESELPISIRGKMGLGFVIVTDAGRVLMATTPIAEQPVGGI